MSRHSLSCCVFRPVLLFFLFLLHLVTNEAAAQQEGKYLFYGQPLKLHPNGISQPLYYPYATVPYNDTIDDIKLYYGGYHIDCDSAGVDIQYSTILTRGELSPIVSQMPGVYLDTSGIGNSMAFPDRANPNLLHTFMPTKQSYPEYAFVQNINLVTYERYTFNVVRNVELADSIAFGLHQVIRHHNRRDYWLVAMKSLQNNWYQPLVWLVSGMQISAPVPQPPVYIHAYSNTIFMRMLQSPDESNIVVNTAKGAFTLFKFDRSTGQLYDRLPVDLQRIFYRPFAGDLLITTMNYSPLGKKLYAFSTDYRAYPFRSRMYQFDLSVWDSLAVTRRFYNYQTQDTTYHDFMPASNNRVYFMVSEPFSGFSSLGHILDPDSNWGIARQELILVGTNRYGPEAIGNVKFNVTRAHYSHPKRYRFSHTTACVGDSIHFRMNEIRNMTHVVWEMGDGVTYSGDSLYDPGHVYQTAGRFRVKATAQFCGQTVMMEDSIFITAAPSAYLPDTNLCSAGSFSVNAFQPLALSDRYLWRDGDTNAVRSIDQPGWWWVDVQGTCGSFRDSFYVSYDPEPFTGLPTDTFYCPGSPGQLVLQPGNYRWSWPDSSTAAVYTPAVNENSVVLQLENHCGRFTETINIHRLEIPDFPEVDTVLCQSLLYIADFSWDAYTHIRWDDGDTSRLREIRKVFSGTAAVNHPCGDSWLEVNIQRERCDCNLFLPTAFTPNGDGLNDKYAPVFDCQSQTFEMSIFDRWGKVIFQTKDEKEAWDGTINGQPAEAGFYAVRVSLLGVASREIRVAGASLLLHR